jgi:hypothetical protein
LVAEAVDAQEKERISVVTVELPIPLARTKLASGPPSSVSLSVSVRSGHGGEGGVGRGQRRGTEVVTNVSQPRSDTMESFSNAAERNSNGLRQESGAAEQAAPGSERQPRVKPWQWWAWCDGMDQSTDITSDMDGWQQVPEREREPVCVI